jgi:hypothetical protein
MSPTALVFLPTNNTLYAFIYQPLAGTLYRKLRTGAKDIAILYITQE